MAAEIKEAGNAAFAAKDFARAYRLYSEAIELDERNAVLYANRSACSFGLGRYVDALRDAARATDIEPGYAKGWSRLATAHEAALEFDSAVEAWEHALSALSKVNPSDAERKQKTQYTASLENARERLAAEAAQPFRGVTFNALTEKTPWEVAEEMLPELQAAGRDQFSSSAYLIYFANQEWQRGIEQINILKKVPAEGTPYGYIVVGHTAGLTSLSNAVMRDMRVFRLDSSDWIEKYNDQVRFETMKHRAPTEENLETIQQLSLQRLKKEGWDSLRPALAVVVRGRIMRAIFDAELNGTPHTAIERLEETLQLLRWGRQVWRDVHKDDRGVIFEDTFIRAVKAIYLGRLTEAHAKAANADKPALLNTILNEARDLIQDAADSPLPTEPNPASGFVSSFYISPVADAHSLAGHCFMQRAKVSESVDDRLVNFALAIEQYTIAAKMLPEDDERHCWYLQLSIYPMIWSGAPKNVLMSVVEQVRAAMPKIQRIWGNSSFAKQGRDAMIEQTLRTAEGT